MDELSVLWVGGERGMEADLVKREAIPFQTIPAAGVHGVGLRALPGNLLSLAKGIQASRRILRRYQPDVLFFTGGYVAVPMALANRLPMKQGKRPRSLVYVPDIEPGLAIKVAARFADHVAVSVDESRGYFAHRPAVTTTGYPLRSGLKSLDRAQARRALGLRTDEPVFLVLGGSKGARSINRALFSALPDLLPEMQVLHISGQLDWPEVEQERLALEDMIGTALAARYHPYPYLYEEMGAALASADLALSRAGASTLGELPLFSLPAILVPYPYAWRYQKVNAEYLVQHGAAVLLRDDELAEQMVKVVHSLMSDLDRRREMQQAMSRIAQPQAAQKVAELLILLQTGVHRTGAQQGK